MQAWKKIQERNKQRKEISKDHELKVERIYPSVLSSILSLLSDPEPQAPRNVQIQAETFIRSTRTLRSWVSMLGLEGTQEITWPATHFKNRTDGSETYITF